jgi:alpha-1,6-mannosyltransferase
MPIKTLHLTNYWHEHSGGIATFYRRLISAANHHQHGMILVVPGEQNEVIEMGAYCRIYKIAAPPSPLNRHYRTIYPREFLLADSKIQRILADERPDLVEVCDKYSLVHLATLLRRRLAYGLNFRPVVVGLTCERMDANVAAYISRSRWAEAFTRFYMRHVYFPAFDYHIAVSENTAGELKAIANGHLVPRGVWIRPMGVDVEHFSPNKRSLELRRQLLNGSENSQNAVLLLYVGRLAPEKNLELLLATMVELENAQQNFRLVLAGEGIAREALQHAAQNRAAGKLVFLGHVPDRDELARLYASCDLFLHPNPAEPFGIAPLEAMASGLPLIAPDRGGITSYANENNAYLVPPSAKAFAQAVLLACQSSAETTRKAQAARETAEALSWSRVTESFLRLYEDLYAVGTGQQPMEAVRPAFVSSNANALQASGLRSAGQVAQASFGAYLRTRRLVASLSKRDQYQTELKDIRT